MMMLAKLAEIYCYTVTHLPEHYGICINDVAVQVSFDFNLKRTLSCCYVGATEAKNI